MLTSHRKPRAPSGAVHLSAMLEAAGSPAPGPLSKMEDAVLGVLWAPSSTSSNRSSSAALAVLGRFLLDHRANADFGVREANADFGVREANAMVRLGNRVLFGSGVGLDQATLGMAAVAAVVEPSQLKTPSGLVRWFVFQVVAAFGLEHLLPGPLVRRLCASEGMTPPAAATWLWNATPALKARLPGGWPSRAAAIDWLLGPERHGLDFLRPVLAQPVPPLGWTGRNLAQISGQVSGRALAAGETIDFTLGGNSDDYCLHGTWFALEPLRRWGRTPTAMLAFCPVVSADASLSLAASFTPSSNFHQFEDSFLTITVAGRTVLRDRWTKLTPHRVVLDIGTAPPPGTVLPVAFQLWPPYQPSRHNSADGRALGVPISLLRLIAW